MTVPATGVDRLIYFVESRLAQLGMTKEEVASRGGPGVDTLTKLRRRGGSAKPSFETFQRYDSVLGWEPGSAAATMLGDQPRSVTAGPRDRNGKLVTALEADDIVTTFLTRLGGEIAQWERLREGVDARLVQLRSIYDGLRAVLGPGDVNQIDEESVAERG